MPHYDSAEGRGVPLVGGTLRRNVGAAKDKQKGPEEL
jgi:hypothetical protein